MLECVKDDRPSKTLLMFKSYLSYTQLKAYLELLEKNQLIKFADKNQTFQITDKGTEYLKNLNQVEELK